MSAETVGLEGWGQALSLVGQNVDAQYAFMGRFAGGSATIGLGIGLAPVAAAAGNEFFFGSSAGRAVWSGQGMMNAAEASGLQTLGRSLAGQIVSALPSSIQSYGWAAASWAWAAGATGAVMPFLNGTPSSNSFFISYELPTLLQNTSVRFLPFY